MKLWMYLVVLFALLAGVVWFGAHERGIGAAGVQAAWDAEKAKTSEAAAAQAYATAQTQSDQRNIFAGIAATYHETITHEDPPAPAVSAADVSSGRVRLRAEWQCASGYVRANGLPQTSIGGSGADATTSAAAEQRSQGASDLVRAADEADQREQRLSAQISALQSILDAERPR